MRALLISNFSILDLAFDCITFVSVRSSIAIVDSICSVKSPRKASKRRKGIPRMKKGACDSWSKVSSECHNLTALDQDQEPRAESREMS